MPRSNTWLHAMLEAGGGVSPGEIRKILFAGMGPRASPVCKLEPRKPLSPPQLVILVQPAPEKK